MKNPLTRKQKIGLTIAAIVTVIAAIAIIQFINKPQDLGEKLTFLNKINTSCEWWEVPLYIGFCSGPKYDYFFATDMSRDELKTYFKKANYIERPSSRGGASADYSYDIILFKNKQEEIYIYYYHETRAVINTLNLKQTNKKHIISMTSEDFRLARESL